MHVCLLLRVLLLLLLLLPCLPREHVLLLLRLLQRIELLLLLLLLLLRRLCLLLFRLRLRRLLRCLLVPLATSDGKHLLHLSRVCVAQPAAPVVATLPLQLRDAMPVRPRRSHVLAWWPRRTTLASSASLAASLAATRCASGPLPPLTWPISPPPPARDEEDGAEIHPDAAAFAAANARIASGA